MISPKQRYERQQGSLSVTLLISVMGGIFSLLLFVELTRYLLARNALQNSVEKVARCLSPTDADCLSSLKPLSTQDSSWFFRQRTNIVEEWVNRFRYSATVREQTWEASGTGYEVHLTEKPPLRWQAAELPRKTFQATLSRYERRRAVIAAQVMAVLEEQHYRVPSSLLTTPQYFPGFDERYEAALDEDAVSAWTPRIPIDPRRPALGFKSTSEFSFMNITLPPQSLSAGESGAFRTAPVEIPDLPSQSNNPSCVDGFGKSCSITPFAGTSGLVDYSWKKYAALAIKPFAELEVVNGSPQVAWAGAPGADGKHWGVEVEVIPPSEWEAYKAARDAAIRNHTTPPAIPSGEIRCLGGRFSSRPLRGRKFFHLWLRGPQGSHGGGEPNCPSAQNATFHQHDSLFIPRGGAFRLGGFLEVTGEGKVDAKVSFQYYFDSYEPYQKIVERETPCLGEYLSPKGEAESNCDPLRACPTLQVRRVLSCNVLALKRIPLCLSEQDAEKDDFIHTLTPVFCGKPIQGLVCSEAEVPKLPFDCNEALRIAPDRLTCGWRETSLGSISEIVPGIPPQCPLARPILQQSDCEDSPREVLFESSGDYGAPSSCSKFSLVKSQASERLSTLLQSSVPGLAPTLAQTQIDFLPLTSQRETGRWAPTISLPAPFLLFLGDTSKVRKGRFHVENIYPIYRHQQNDWKPPLSSFGFLNPKEDSSSLEFRLLRESVKAVSHVYPFSGNPVFEIPGSFFGESQAIGGAEKPRSLEERLREYAEAEVPELRAAEVELETKAEFVESIPTSRKGSCSSDADFTFPLPPNTPVSRREVLGVLCPEPRYLGNFSRDDFPHGPPICRTSKLISCFEQPFNVLSSGSDKEQLDILAAQSEGLRSIQRVFPQSTLGCSSDACVNFEISSPDDSHLQVHGRFSLPIGFPMSDLLNQESILLEKTVTEIREAQISRAARPMENLGNE